LLVAPGERMETDVKKAKSIITGRYEPDRAKVFSLNA
jgi:hypothetical protein